MPTRRSAGSRQHARSERRGAQLDGRLTAAAEGDFEEILRWTLDQLGEVQARTYFETISAALNDLAAGPTIVGARKRDDILKGIFTLHVARKGRHFVMFRVGRAPERKVIEVLHLLHDAMDLQRHLPTAEESS